MCVCVIETELHDSLSSPLFPCSRKAPWQLYNLLLRHFLWTPLRQPCRCHENESPVQTRTQTLWHQMSKQFIQLATHGNIKTINICYNVLYIYCGVIKLLCVAIGVCFKQCGNMEVWRPAARSAVCHAPTLYKTLTCCHSPLRFSWYNWSFVRVFWWKNVKLVSGFRLFLKKNTVIHFWESLAHFIIHWFIKYAVGTIERW